MSQVGLDAARVQRGEGPQGPWTLVPLEPGERALLAGMFQLYYYDFSELDHDDLGEDGRFRVADLDRFLDPGSFPGHHALILRVAGKPAGFALVDEESPLPGSRRFRYVHEFHVLRAYRRGGYGQAMAWAVFDRFPGPWQVEQIGPNAAAQRFWRRVIDRYTGGRYRERTVQGRRFPLVIQEFDTADRVAP
jgi:predicted acetyltransferase